MNEKDVKILQLRLMIKELIRDLENDESELELSLRASFMKNWNALYHQLDQYSFEALDTLAIDLRESMMLAWNAIERKES